MKRVGPAGAEELRISPDQWGPAIAATEGPQIVVGGPGTGKTEFLVRRLLYLAERVPTEQLLVLSFGRRGVADLANRVRRQLERSIGQLDITTFHSLAGRIMERHYAARGWSEAPMVLTGPEQISLVHDLLSKDDPDRWSPAFRGLLTSPTFATEVTDFLLRVREQLLGAGELEAKAAERADWKGIPQFLTRYDLELRRRNRIDYGTLLSEAIATLQLDVATAVAEGFRYVIVDEYQDTTVAQAALLKSVVGEPGNITAAADPYQSIYSFRGTDLANVARFPDTFRHQDGSPGKRVVLTTSFRTPAEVLAAAERVASGELPGAAGPVVPARGDGRVDVYLFEQETEEAEWIASEVQRLHMQGTPHREMGVFVRSKRRFLKELSRALARRGVPHDTPAARLADQPAVRFLFDLVIAAGSDDPGEVARAVRRVLLGPLFRLPPGRLRDVERFALAAGRGWPAAIRELVPDSEVVAGLIERDDWALESPASAGFWTVWSTLPQLQSVVAEPERGDERAAWASLGQVLGRWNERNPKATLDDYRVLSEEEDFEARPLLSFKRPEDDRLTLTTLHQSKGLEFDVVFVADAVEGVLPDLRTRDSLLGVRHLLPHVPTDAAGYVRFRLQEERRLAYTAMTRARRRVVWTVTSTGFEEGAGVPSRFLALVAGVPTVTEATTRPPENEAPVTPSEAEAWLRTILRDPAAAAPLRVAAATVLAEGPGWGLRSVEDFAGARRRGASTGLVPDRFSMSPSQAERYELCPRRYVLERRLKVGDETNVYAEFGLLIHGILEEVERAALERGEPHGTASEAAEQLDRVFNPAVFGGGAFAQAWHRRAADTLDRIYEMWPSRGNAVALEHKLEMDIDGIEWLGYADRIETDGLHLTVVDYKTTRSPITKAEAATSLQLGYYLLATGADPALTERGVPERAELWYPAVRSKKALTTRSFDPDRLFEVRHRMVAAAAGISAEDWRARPGPQCERCRVRRVCPAQPEGREAFT